MTPAQGCYEAYCRSGRRIPSPWALLDKYERSMWESAAQGVLAASESPILTIEEAFREMSHAHQRPNWFTDGPRAAERHFLMWLSKGTGAIAILRAALVAASDESLSRQSSEAAESRLSTRNTQGSNS